MKKIILVIMFILCLSIAYAGQTLYDYKGKWTIIKQDYMEGYIHYDFVFVNYTHYRIDWEITDKGNFVFNILNNCFESEDEECLTLIVNQTPQYFPNAKIKITDNGKYKIQDFIDDEFTGKTKLKIKNDIIKLKTDKTFPKNVTFGKAKVLGGINPFGANYGSIYVEFETPLNELIQELNLTIGFGTLITSFSNGESTATFNWGINGYNDFIDASYGFPKNYTLTLNYPRYSQLNNASIRLKNITANNAIHYKYDYFDDGSIDSTVWSQTGAKDSGYCDYSITEVGSGTTTGYLHIYTECTNGALRSAYTYITGDQTNFKDVRNSTILINLDLTIVSGGGTANSGFYIGVYNQTNGGGVNCVTDKYAGTTTGRTNWRLYINNSVCGYYDSLSDTSPTVEVSTLGLNSSVPWSIRFWAESNQGGSPVNPTYTSALIYMLALNQNISYLNWTNKSVNPTDVKLKIGSITSFYNASLTGEVQFNITKNISDSWNNGACDCSGCALTSSYCQIPFTFFITNGSKLNFSDLNIDVNISTSNLTVNIYDADTLLKLNKTNITNDLVGILFQLQNITDSGKAFFIIPFNSTDTDEISLRSYQRDTPRDYEISIRNISVQQGGYYTINMYLLNVSDTTRVKQVTFRVIDSYRNRIEGAKVLVYKQNPATGQYIEITDLTTNSNGEATTYLIKNVAFYQFVVAYQGSVVYTSLNPVQISDYDDVIVLTINLDAGYTDLYQSIFGNTSLSFVRTTNFTGIIRTAYSYDNTVQICTDIYNGTGKSLNQSLCYNGTSGIFDSTFLNASNRTLFMAFTFVDKNDGYGFQQTDSLFVYIGEGLGYEKSFGQEGLILPILAVVTGAFGFMSSPILGLILMSIIFIIILMMGVTPIQVTVISSIVALAIFTIVTYSKRP